MKIQVGIISHKPGEMLARCLNSLIGINAGLPYELLLQIGPWRSNAENWNDLFERFEADYMCILEDDTAALRPFWLKSLVDTMEVHKQCGIVMPVETKDCIHPDAGFMQWLNKTTQVPQVYGFCNLIRRGVELRADEDLTYFVDIDLGYQAQAGGWQCMCNGHVWMLHGAGAGRMSDDPGIKEAQEKDREHMNEKWKGEKAA